MLLEQRLPILEQENLTPMLRMHHVYQLLLLLDLTIIQMTVHLLLETNVGVKLQLLMHMTLLSNLPLLDALKAQQPDLQFAGKSLHTLVLLTILGTANAFLLAISLDNKEQRHAGMDQLMLPMLLSMVVQAAFWMLLMQT